MKNLSEYLIKAKREMSTLLRAGDRNRIKRQTKMNLSSSRSHTIFRVTVECNRENNGTFIVSRETLNKLRIRFNRDLS